MPIFIDLTPAGVMSRAAYSLLTLYMMVILLAWCGPWLQIDLSSGRLRWVRRLSDPLVDGLRRLLPPMGPFDFGPIAALFVVWVARSLCWAFFEALATQTHIAVP